MPSKEKARAGGKKPAARRGWGRDHRGSGTFGPVTLALGNLRIIAEAWSVPGRSAASFHNPAYACSWRKAKTPAVRETLGAANALGKIGANRVAVIPVLEALLGDPDREVQRSAIDALVRFGPAAIPTLAVVLSDPNEQNRRDAVSALGFIGPAAVSALVAALRNPDRDVRSEASGRRGRIGPAAAEAVPVLAAAVANDPDKGVRKRAAWALWEVGATAAEAIPPLASLFNDADSDVAQTGAWVLAKFGKAAVLTLNISLKHPDKLVRSMAMWALGSIGTVAGEAVPALVALLRDPDTDVYRSALSALQEIGAGGVDSVPALEQRDFFHWLSALIALPAAAYAGQPFFHSAVRALMAGKLNMDVPITLGVLLALGMSVLETLHHASHAYFDSAMMLLTFLLAGRALDQNMRRRTRVVAGNLAALKAETAIKLTPGGDLREVPIASIQPGDLVLVRPGERVAVDGVVVEGASEIDQSLVTGETMRAPAGNGTAVYAGTMNGYGTLRVRVGAADGLPIVPPRSMPRSCTSLRSRRWSDGSRREPLGTMQSLPLSPC
jgi:HEAT repeat protein